MPSFEEEAFARASQLHRRDDRRKPPPKPEPPKPEPKPQPPKPQPPKAPELLPEKAPNLMETLFADKDKSLILLLLMLLMDGESDPSLLFALAYLLM